LTTFQWLLVIPICTLAAVWAPLGLIRLLETWGQYREARQRRLAALWATRLGVPSRVQQQHADEDEGVPPSGALNAMRMAMDATLRRNRVVVSEDDEASASSMFGAVLKEAEVMSPRLKAQQRVRAMRTRQPAEAKEMVSE
jgi:hypothetical protein